MRTIEEKPEEAARRISHDALQKGFLPQGLHCYTDRNGQSLFFLIRLKHPETGEKWIRPMHRNGNGFVLGFPKGLKSKPLYQLDMITKSPDATVWLVEGERVADLLNAEFKRLEIFGQNLASTSGGADSVNRTDWLPLRGHRTFLWPDNDDAGQKYVEDIAGVLVNLECDISTIDVDQLALPAKGDFVEFLERTPNLTEEDLLNLPRIKFGLVRECPRPLHRKLPAAPQFPVNALGPVLGPVARRACEVIQAPEAICCQTFLAAAAIPVQCHANILLDGRTIVLSEFFITVGESGERKSAVDLYALYPHRLYENELRDQALIEKETYNRDAQAYNAARDEALRKAKGLDAKRAVLNELGDSPVPPLLSLLLVEEPTFEGLIKLLELGQCGIGLFSDEGGRFISGHGMSEEHRLKTASGLCNAWDGKAITRVRAGEGAAILPGKRLSLHLMVQPGVATRLLSNSVYEDQGLLSRCLVCSPDSTAGSRSYSSVNLNSTPEMEHYNSRMLELLRHPKPLAPGKRNELAPRELHLSPEAKKIFIQFYNFVEQRLSTGGEYRPIRGFANKVPEHALRLAGILTLVEDIHRTEIHTDQMLSGIDLANFYLQEALRLFNAGILDEHLVEAEKLLGWLHSLDHDVVSTVEIYQYGIVSVRTAGIAKKLMGILVEHGWAEPVKGGTEFKGTKRKDAWRIFRA